MRRQGPPLGRVRSIAAHRTAKQASLHSLHTGFLAYASDRGFISTARCEHGIDGHEGYGASLDHSIWFHRPPRFDDWVLFSSRSPIAHAARALILGQMHTRDGTHIASVSQEGLVRPVRPGRYSRREALDGG